jgi:predicted small lipoprotein YifL
VPSRVTSLICLTLLALALAGCGRAGPLEPPPGTPPGQPTGSVNSSSTMTGDINSTAPQTTGTTGSNANPPSKGGQPFLLDPLVK